MSTRQRLPLRPCHVRQLRQWLSPRSCRCFHDGSILQSGHSRWSKIKHDKGKVDATKNKQRSIFAQEIATASKLFGGDPNSNPRLADLITKAKRASFSKTSIEAAIARGQGRSLSGAALEAVSVEGIISQNVAVIIDCETDNKLRTLADVRVILRDHGGTVTPSSYLFTKKGRIVFERKEDVGVDDVFDQALEAGALDVLQDADGGVVVFTEPNETKATGETLSQALLLDIASSDIVWDANEETEVAIEDSDAADRLSAFVEELQDKESSVTGVYMNVARGSLDEGAWADLQSKIAA